MTFHWDKLLNFTTGLGIPGADKGASAQYSLVLLQPDQLEAAYRSDWIVRKAIEFRAFELLLHVAGLGRRSKTRSRPWRRLRRRSRSSASGSAR